MEKLKSSYVRNMIFGAEDSLVSTVGVLFGVAAANSSRPSILLTGMLVIAVEALSMGVGAYLSETSEKELENKEYSKEPAVGGLFMFISYFVAGFIPLLPFIIVQNSNAKFVSVGVTLVALFMLGYIPQRKIRSAFRMLVVAGLAVLVGFLIATFFKIDA